MKIMNCVGNHPITIVKGAELSPLDRKYHGGEVASVIPFSGRMLSAKTAEAPSPEEWEFNGVKIPVAPAAHWVAVDPLPEEDDTTFYGVSVAYATACKAVGYPTDRLLIVGGAVVDDGGRVIGAAFLSRFE